jgi:hypothetical protein
LTRHADAVIRFTSRKQVSRRIEIVDRINRFDAREPAAPEITNSASAGTSSGTVFARARRGGVRCQPPAVRYSSASNGILEAALNISAGGAPIATATGSGAPSCSAAC